MKGVLSKKINGNALSNILKVIVYQIKMNLQVG